MQYTKIRLILWFSFLSLLLHTPLALASWGSFVSMGTTVVNADVSCAPTSAGKAVCAATGMTNTLLVNKFDGAKWSGWSSLAGVITSPPSCASDGNANAVCAARASNGGLAATVFDGTTWSAEVNVKGTLSSGPSCASLGHGRVLCTSRSSTGGLASTIYNGSTWSAFANQPVKSTSGPNCTSDDAGRVICAMVDNTSSIIVNRYNGSAWEGFINIAGRNTGAAVCTDLGVSGQVACFGRGEDTALWGRRFNGGSWTLGQWGPWGSLGGLVGPKASCGVVRTNEIICSVFGIDDSALWVNEFNGSTWLGWTRLGQSTVCTPGCTALGGGKVLCAAVNVNNSVSSIVGP